MTDVINVKVTHLRPTYQSLDDWIHSSQNHLYIGRKMHYVKGADGSKWQNPFTVKKYGLEQSLQLYEDYIRNTPHLWHSLLELENKILGCWCVPYHDCHGHVLQRLISEYKNNVKH